MKAYRLNVYKPYWINNDKIINFYHIEDILAQLNIVGAWEEIPKNNISWKNVNELTFKGNISDTISYIKIIQNDRAFYYKKVTNEEIGTINRNGELIVTFYFELDLWNTYIHELVELLKQHNCLVHFKKCFLDRLLRYNDKYVLNYNLQKYLADIIPLPNLTTQREYVHGTTARHMYELNNPTIAWDNLPEQYEIHNWNNNAETFNLNVKQYFTSEENISADNHRFCYIIAKSSAMRKVNNQKDLSTNTSQKIMIIPLPATNKSDILHALNDINVTLSHDSAVIVGNSNTISSKLVELPYALLFDWYLKNTDKCQFLYGRNFITEQQSFVIPFFLIDFNQPLLFNIFDYLGTTGEQGIGKKLRQFINNLDKLLPTTEPLMFNPNYYYELYNNGLTQYSTSFADLNLEFPKNQEINYDLTLQAYFNFFSNIDMSFYYGNKTNTYQPDLDNTHTKTIDISIPFGLGQGANATYLEQNLNSGYVGILNRQSEKSQAIGDTVFSGLGSIFSAISGAFMGRIPSPLAFNLGKSIMDTTMEQQRADNNFYASIKNTINSPNNINTSPYSKANIPLPNIDGNYLMCMYSILLNQQCIDKIFSEYLHNGYVYDAEDNINKFVNRKYMNILSIASLDRLEDILTIWENNYHDNIFSNKTWFTKALAFLSETHNVYMTPYLVNCTNYKAEDYLHNIEIESYDIRHIKIDINTYIKHFNKTLIQFDESIIWNQLKLDNPDLTDEIIQDLELVISEHKIIINAKATSQEYTGQVVFFPYVYKLELRIAKETAFDNYYVWNINSLSTNLSSGRWEMTLGTDKGEITFNSVEHKIWNIELNYITDITSIPNQFLRGFTYQSQYLIIPDHVTTIGSNFMSHCDFSTLFTPTLPANLTTIHVGFLESTTGHIGVGNGITLPARLTYIGQEFLLNSKLSWLIDFGNLQPNIFQGEEKYYLSTSDSTSLLYTTGVQVRGTYTDDIITYLPNMSGEQGLYRKLIKLPTNER